MMHSEYNLKCIALLDETSAHTQKKDSDRSSNSKIHISATTFVKNNFRA